jgi:OHCU decarboxylase
LSKIGKVPAKSFVIMTIASLNASSREDFVAALAGIWEHSPWIADRAWNQRPFGSSGDLLSAMWSTVLAASPEEQLALIVAHPDLAGKLARANRLTAESAGEQAGVGLDALTDEERSAFDARNTAYRERFGFPFIICAREHTKSTILAAFDARLHHSQEAEISEALEQIRRIAKFRIQDLIKE